MKSFFARYSYMTVKLFLNQFAIALFGMGLAFACAKAGNDTLLYVTCGFSVLFYLFLQYAVMWEVGAKDGISAVARKQSRGLWRGFAVAMLANTLNFLLAFFSIFRDFAVAGSGLSRVGAGCRAAAMLLQGMYYGGLSVPFGGLQLHDFAWVYFVLPLPAVLVSGVSYILGSYNLHATNILIPKNKDVKNNGRPE
jgi:hypothetical protein